MSTRKITTAFAATVAALLFGTVAAFGAEPRVWTNSRGEIALQGTLDVERTLDETPGVEAPNRVYFVDAIGDLYSFRYRHLSEADRALVDEALDEPAPPKKVGTRRDVAPPLGTPVRTTPLGIPASRPRAEANLVGAPPVVSPKSNPFFASKRPATVQVKIKLVDATGAPIPGAWFQGKILGGAATTSLSGNSGLDGGFTIALTPGVEYEALVTAPRGESAVFYEKAKFRAPEATNFNSASLTLNVGVGKELKLTDRAAQEISNEFRPADEKRLEAAPLDNSPSADATSRNGKTAAFETKTAMKLKFVDASGAPIPKITAQVQRIKRPSPTHWWRSESGEGVYTIDLAPGGYEARATAWRGNEVVIYAGTRFVVGQGNGEPVELTLNLGGICVPVDEAQPAENAPNDEKAEASATHGWTELASSLDLAPAKFNDDALKGIPTTTLKVVDSDGKPVPGAKIDFKERGSVGGVCGHLTADAQGVQVVRIPSGEYDALVKTANERRGGLTFVVPNEENAVVELKIGGEASPAVELKPTENAELEPGGNGAVGELRAGDLDATVATVAAVVRIVDADGKPVSWANAQFRPDWRAFDETLIADADGVVKTELQVGRAWAFVKKEDGTPYVAEPFEVVDAKKIDVVLTLNDETKRLKVKVENGENGDALKPAEPASNDEKAEASATFGSAARKSNAVESREKTTIKVVDVVGKPVPFAVVEASQVVQEDDLTVYFELRADGEGVVAAELSRGVEYEATVRANVPERVLEEGETGLVGLVAKKYEGLRFNVPEGTGERVVVLTLSDDAEVADKAKTAEAEENALNDGKDETSDAEETSEAAPTSN